MMIKRKEGSVVRKLRKKKETILVLSAHSDDFVLGAGGTIANYTQEGKKVIAIVFSYGEKSHPWLKEEVVQKMRSKETLDASKILHCKVIFFDLQEMKFAEDYQQKNLEPQFLEILRKEKPCKIFTHSLEDPHPDHKDVYNLTLQWYNQLSFKPELYIYSIWNPISLKTTYPSLYVNITKSFSTKLKALKTFHSQRLQMAYPFALIIFRALLSGFKLRTLFAEKFFRLK